MHSADIQAEIKKAGFTQKQLANEYGCSEFYVSKVINEKWGSEPLMRFIAKKIGKKAEAVFPEYFSREPKRTRNAA